jgi:Flp pilus assembly protein TadG
MLGSRSRHDEVSARHRGRTRAGRRGQRGQTMVEMGLILPIMLVMVVGVIETVTLFNHYITVVNASRDGARIGSKGGSITDAEIRSLIANDLSRLPNGTLITPTVDITINRTPVPGDTAIQVSTCYNHKIIMHINLIMPETVRVCSATTMKMLPTPAP